MTRIVQLAIDFPLPPLSGGDIRSAFVARSARAIGPLHVISFGPANELSSENGLTSTTIPSFSGTVPWHRHDRKVRTMIQLTTEDLVFLQEEIKRYAPDVAICEGVGVCAALPVLKRLGVPAIIDMHNIESALGQSIRRNSSTTKFLKDIVFGRKQWRAAKEFDRDASLQAHETWLTSEDDRSQLLEMGGADGIVIPNPIPDESLSNIAINAQRYATKKCLFVGHLSYPPNVAAVSELATGIWPAIQAADPDASLLIGGRTPTSTIMRMNAKQGITVQANPIAFGPILGQHAYALMPIRIGGGTRIKVLEAMVAGTVVIATKKAVEGLQLTPSAHYLRAERPAEFKKQIEHACAHPHETAALAENARAYVLTNYASSRLSDRVQDRIVKVATSRARSLN